MDPLRTMFRHHRWATLKLIDHCANLRPEQLAETVPGTYGSIMDTLVHLVGADQRYLRRMDGLAAEPRIHETETATLADLRAAIEAQAARWEAVTDRAPELDGLTGSLATLWTDVLGTHVELDDRTTRLTNDFSKTEILAMRHQ